MMKKVFKKAVAVMVLVNLVSLGTAPSLKAMNVGLGGSLIQTTPYDGKMSEAGILVDYLPAGRIETAESLFLKARSIRYTSDGTGADHWQSPAETESRWAGDCEDKAIWLYTQLKMNGYRHVRLVVGRHRSISSGFHVWVTFSDENGENLYVLDPTAQKRIWRSEDFAEGTYKPAFSFDGIARYRHDS